MVITKNKNKMKLKQNKTKRKPSLLFSSRWCYSSSLWFPPCPKTPAWFPESILFTGVTTIFASVQRICLQSGERYGFDTWSVEWTASCQRPFRWGSLKNLWADFFSSPGRIPLMCPLIFLYVSFQISSFPPSHRGPASVLWVLPERNGFLQCPTQPGTYSPIFLPCGEVTTD